MVRRCLFALLAVFTVSARVASAQAERRHAAGSVSLPFEKADQAGNQWLIYQNGMLQQRGNTPIFTQGAMLLVNGENVQQGNNANRAARDEKSGELLIECNAVNGVNITRHILIRADADYVRYIDVFKNNTAQPQSLDVQLQTRINFGFVNTQSVPDPTGGENGGERAIGWVGQTGANRAVVLVTAGRGSRNPLVINAQQDQSLVQGDIAVSVPANAELAVMSLYTTAATIDAGTQFVTSLKDRDVVRDCPANLRRELVNFSAGDLFIGEREVLRGAADDVIELRGASNNSGSGSSDQLNGTLRDASYTLHTFYGDITLPAQQVLGMVSVGQYRPRQLLVTADGQIFGGILAKSTVSMELASGQVTEVPLAQISRFGYRKHPEETSSTDSIKNPSSPLILLRSGDRIAVKMPTEPIEFLTRFGSLKLLPATVNSITFQSENNPVHTLLLTDGTRLSGLLQAQQLTLILTSGTPSTQSATEAATPDHSITVPVAAIARMQLSAVSEEGSAETDSASPQPPTLQLSSGDLLLGKLSGTFKIDTAFDTLTINAPEIKTLTHARDAGSDVQIQLWDGSRISGSIADITLPCTLVSGTELSVPVALIDIYSQPQPVASKQTLGEIEATVKDLSSDDWKTREAAEAKLVSLGPVVIAPLKSMSGSLPPEAQQRIEAVLKTLAAKKSPAHAANAAGQGDAGGMVMPQN